MTTDARVMKPIAECSKEERMERALLAIESLAMCEDSGNEDTFAGKIYMIAHAGHGRCPHEKWLALIEECEKFGRKQKLYFVEEMVGT